MRSLSFLIVLLLIANNLYSQDFVDIVKFSGNTTDFETLTDNFSTQVDNFQLEVYYPTRLSEASVLLTGFTLEKSRLGLANNLGRTNLGMTRLNIGIKQQHSEKWSGTYVFLPKIASDFESIGSDDFQFGGIAVLDYQHSDLWKWKFGLYSSSENFGTIITPIVGLWHRSIDEKFYINATLPVRMDVNYSLGQNTSIGADLLTSVKSYNLSEFEPANYVQEESIRFAAYAAYGFFDDKIIIKGKAGFDSTDYGLYNDGDTVGAQLLTFDLGGDDRNRLNNEFDTAPYFGVDLLYRFDLTTISEEK